MRLRESYVIVMIIVLGFSHSSAFPRGQGGDSCRSAFLFVTGDPAVAHSIQICCNAGNIPESYKADINMPVCNDSLCANVILRIYWDLAGNYKGFDTIPGKPLTKFDHQKFLASDYLKLDQILKTRNSRLRILKVEDLIDKSVEMKASTLDAVTGATPKTIKNAVVDGAVYSSFTLWHFVNGAVKDSMAAFTQRIYSESVARQMLTSGNYETQLYALKNWSETDYELHTDLLFNVIRQSVPIIRAYIINHVPLPFSTVERNREFAALYPRLDSYSKSVFLDRVGAGKKSATLLLPLIISMYGDFEKKQWEQIAVAYRKFEIPGYQELVKMVEIIP